MQQARLLGRKLLVSVADIGLDVYLPTSGRYTPHHGRGMGLECRRRNGSLSIYWYPWRTMSSYLLVFVIHKPNVGMGIYLPTCVCSTPLRRRIGSLSTYYCLWQT